MPLRQTAFWLSAKLVRETSLSSELYGELFLPICIESERIRYHDDAGSNGTKILTTPHPTKITRSPVPVSISPIFTADSVTITVSREKDGKLRIVYAGWDDYKVAQPDEVLELGPARRAWRAESCLAGRGGADPPEKLDPPPDPPRFSPAMVTFTCIEPCIFRPRF